MNKQTRSELRFLIDRIARISASEDWSDGLNPTQRAAISYLARANRFSRMPSQVADYLSATRGTVSQTLKALARKGLVIEVRSERDRRSVSYEVTPEGQNALEVDTLLDAALAELGTKDAANLTTSMKALAKCLLSAREGRSFGICKTCRHHLKGKTGAHCALLEVELLPEETEQLCHEHEAAA